MKRRSLLLPSLIAAAISPALMAQDVTGIVVDPQGEPIANAAIKIKGKTVFTNEQGKFSFIGLDDHNHEVHIVAQGYLHKNQQVAKDTTAPISVTLSPTVLEIIDVTATPLHVSTIESALPVNVLAGDKLRTKQASTLGDTLKNEVGVHSTSYGGVASSPVIRGLDGPRVLVAQNGLDVGDASRVGADHIVSVEAATATQIEVLRGPSTLFYGSGAIGGVVNVVDQRVPTTTDTQFDYMLKHSDVNDEDEASFNLNTGTGNVALHLDGFWRESNDINIPGYAELHHDEHEEEHDDHDEDHHDEDEHDDHEEGVKGVIENTAAKASGFNLGASYLLDNGFIGMSYGRTDREYGIPGHSHGEHEEDHDDDHMDEHDEEEHHEENVSGDLEQDRFQLLSDLSFNDQFISRVATKFAYTDYTHQEIEGGEVETEFSSEMLEGRVDLYHHEMNGWKGAWSVHYKDTDFEAIGAEAFTPPSETESIAVAWVEEKHVGDVLWQLGLRVEHVEISADDHFLEHDDEEHHDEDEDEHHDEDEHGHEEDLHLEKQDFTPVSASVGAVWDYQEGYNLGFSASFSQRAPAASELFSNGPHIGTNSYEVGVIFDVEEHGDHVDIELGNQDVEMETAYNLDLTWRKFTGDFGFVISAFYNQVEDYYYLENTGLYAEDGHDHDAHEEDHDDDHAEEEGHDEEGLLPIFAYSQADVDMYGFEAEFVYQVSQPLKATLFTDYIRAELSDGGNLPRIPPMRIGTEFDYTKDNYAISLSASHYFEQDDIADYETETDSYTIVDANVNFYLDGIGNDFVLFVKGENLTDEEARVHGSFLKDVAPLPGRNLSVGVRGSF